MQIGVQKFHDIIKASFPDSDIKIILDLGSRDLEESITLSNIYKNAKIYAFECNPPSYQECISKSANYPNIKVVDKAVREFDGKCSFYPIDTEKHDNIGASSIFIASGKYDDIEKLPQTETVVDCIRLNTWAKENNIDKVDLIWMDLQGAELLALKGLGDLLKSVKAMYTEVEFQEMYKGQVLFNELNTYLVQNGFKHVETYMAIDKWFGDAIYINSLNRVIDTVEDIKVYKNRVIEIWPEYVPENRWWAPTDYLSGTPEFIVETAQCLANKRDEQQNLLYDVRVYYYDYNSNKTSIVNGVKYLSKDKYEGTDTVLAINAKPPKLGKRNIYWSCRYVDRDKDYLEFDERVVPSRFAQSIFGQNSKVIYHGCWADRYNSKYKNKNGEKSEKIKNQCLFSSSPDRGSDFLKNIWNDVEKETGAKLITTYNSNITNDQMDELYRTSQFWLHPMDNNAIEMFCISGQKAQAAGCIPIYVPEMALGETIKYGIKTTRDRFKDDLINTIKLFSRIKDPSIDLEKTKTIKEIKSWDSVTDELEKLLVPNIETINSQQKPDPDVEIINVENIYSSRIQFLVNNAIKNKGKILNIGCADHFMFKDLDLDVLNVDITDECIPDEYKLKIKFHKCDAHSLPFNNNTFSCAILGDTLEHVKDPVQVLREAKRVANNIYITVPNEYNWHKDLNPFKNIGHLRYYTYQTLKQDLDKVFGNDNCKITRYDGGGWSFFFAKYETIPNTDTNDYKLRNKLKIGLISTPFFTLPPKGYSGLEQVVWDLACGLDEMGHSVTIFGPEGSQPTKHGKLIVTGPSISTVNVDWFQAEKNAYENYKSHIESGDYDSIIDNTWFAFAYLSKMSNNNINLIHVHHGGYSWESLPPIAKPNLVSISKWMKSYTEQYFRQKGFNIQSEYVYNSVNLDKYKFDPNTKKSNRLLYIGRFSRFKGADIAIQVAKKTNLPIDLIGGTFIDDPNYLKEIESLCDKDNIVIYKDVDHDFKIKKLQEAKALLVPSRFNEPFGLTCVEGMACGIPILAFRDGAIPELVIDEQTGYICDTIDDMITNVKI